MYCICIYIWFIFMANVVKYTSPMDPMGYIFGGLTGLPKPSIFLFGVSGKKSEETEGILNWETPTPPQKPPSYPKKLIWGNGLGPCSLEFSDLLVHWWLSHKNLSEGRILPYLTTWAAKWGIKSKPSSFDMFGPVRPIKKSSRQCHRLPCPPTSWSTQFFPKGG